MRFIEGIINNQVFGGDSGTANDLKNSIDLKQNITDNSLTTTSKTIVGAINELDLEKAPINNPVFTGTVSGVTQSMVGLGNVTNESKATMFLNPVFTGNATTPTPNLSDSDTSIASTEFVKGVAGNKYTFDTVEDTQTATWLVEGDIIETLGYYEKGDGKNFKFTVDSSSKNGEGVSTTSGLFLNIIRNIDDIETSDGSVGKYINQKEQIDFFELFDNKIKVKHRQVEIFNDTKGFLITDVYNDLIGVGYYFVKTADDYITCGTIITGNLILDNNFSVGKYYNENFSKTGVWIDSTSSISGYTSEVGATITFKINNLKNSNSLYSKHQCRNDGGDFNVIVKNNEIEIMNKTISTYNDVSVKKDFLLFENAPIGELEIIFTFLGNGSRGWMTSLASYSIFLQEELYKFLDSKYFTTPSNKDFAIEFKPQEAENFNFFPAHNGINTCTNLVDTKYYKDGVEITDFSRPYKKKCNTFEIIQECNVSHPESVPSRILGVLKTVTQFNDKGLAYDGFFKENEKLKYKNGYVMMGVANTTNFSKLVTGIGNVFDFTSTEFGTNIPLAKEADDCYNYAFFSDKIYNEKMAILLKIKNPRNTLRKFLNKKQKNAMTYLQIRDSFITKIYSNIFDGSGGQIVDDKLVWSGEYKFLNNPVVKIVKDTIIK